MDLYPLKFETIYKDKIWGGQKLNTILNKNLPKNINIGETWEISGVEGNISVVKNGFLAENTIEELIEIYMGDLVGAKVYEKFGLEFPLLLKFIDAQDDLSIQVHPNDKLANERQNAYGKSEMWYIIESDKNAKLISSFNKKTNKKEYLEKLENRKLTDILNFEKVKEEDVFDIPAGRVHAICKGILLAEIQQTSDITYRIYDWDRKDAEGNERELHTDLALDAIDFKHYKNYKTEYKKEENFPYTLIKNKYFTTNKVDITKKSTFDYFNIDSFIVYMCLDGEFNISYNDEITNIKKGETVLLPAEATEVILIPVSKSEILEIYIE
jgi:mannose-6-phosphate isomerase